MSLGAYALFSAISGAAFGVILARSHLRHRRDMEELRQATEKLINEAANEAVQYGTQVAATMIGLLLRRVGPWLECDECGGSPRPAFLRLSPAQELSVLCQECAARAKEPA